MLSVSLLSYGVVFKSLGRVLKKKITGSISCLPRDTEHTQAKGRSVQESPGGKRQPALLQCRRVGTGAGWHSAWSPRTHTAHGQTKHTRQLGSTNILQLHTNKTQSRTHDGSGLLNNPRSARQAFIHFYLFGVADAEPSWCCSSKADVLFLPTMCAFVL